MNDDMSFWDHLDELRGVLLRIVLLMVALAVGSFLVMPWLMDKVILAPCDGSFPLYRLFDAVEAAFSGAPAQDVPFRVNLVSLELTSQFMIHMSASLWLAFVLAFPVILYLLWSFVAPGLYEREKQGVRRAYVVGNVMFYIGAAVGYFLVFPLTLRFLADYHLSGRIDTLISLESYMDNFFMLMLVMGAVFELPLIAWFLGKAGILRRSFFSRYRRHAIVVLLIVAAVITPTGDPFSLLIVFLPIYALWEFSRRLVPR